MISITEARARQDELLSDLKALVEIDSDRILGFTGFAVDAGEIMCSVQIAIIAGLPYTALREAVLTHPTLIEGLNFLFATEPTAGIQPKRKIA